VFMTTAERGGRGKPCERNPRRLARKKGKRNQSPARKKRRGEGAFRTLQGKKEKNRGNSRREGGGRVARKKKKNHYRYRGMAF